MTLVLRLSPSIPGSFRGINNRGRPEFLSSWVGVRWCFAPLLHFELRLRPNIPGSFPAIGSQDRPESPLIWVFVSLGSEVS